MKGYLLNAPPSLAERWCKIRSRILPVRWLRGEHFGPVVLLLSPLVLLGWTLGSARSPADFPLDLIPTYVAAELWRSGAIDSVYHSGAWLPPSGPKPAWLAALGEARLPLPDTAFVYSPVYLALAAPFTALLPPRVFFWSFAALSAVAALFLGWESSRLARVRRPSVRMGLSLAAALSFPCSYAGMLGQNVIIAAALVLLAFRAFSLRSTAQGTFFLLLACAFKPWCVALLGVLLFARELRSCAVATLSYVGVFWISPLWWCPATMVSGYQDVLRDLTRTSVLAFNNISLRSFVRRTSIDDWTPQAFEWAKHGYVTAFEAAVELFISGTLLVLLILIIRRRQPSFDVLYASAMGLVLVPLGVCWSHYLVFALPLIIIAVFRATSPATKGLAILAGVWVLKMMSSSAPSPAAMQPPALWALVYGLPLFLVALLAPLTLLDVTRRNATDARPLQGEQPLNNRLLVTGVLREAHGLGEAEGNSIGVIRSSSARAQTWSLSTALRAWWMGARFRP